MDLTARILQTQNGMDAAIWCRGNLVVVTGNPTSGRVIETLDSVAELWAADHEIIRSATAVDVYACCKSRLHRIHDDRAFVVTSPPQNAFFVLHHVIHWRNIPTIWQIPSLIKFPEIPWRHLFTVVMWPNPERYKDAAETFCGEWDALRVFCACIAREPHSAVIFTRQYDALVIGVSHNLLHDYREIGRFPWQHVQDIGEQCLRYRFVQAALRLL